MARPTKLGLDYFPHDTHTDQDTALSLVEAEFGLEAYAVYFKLLEFIYSQGYAIPWGSDECLLFAKRIGAFGVSSKISEIIKGLVRRSLFDEGVFNSFQILTSASIQVRWLEAKRKKVEEIEKNIRLVPDNRTAPEVSAPKIGVNTSENGVFAAKTRVSTVKTRVSTVKTPVSAEITPQSKVKESRVEYTSSPNVEEVRPSSDGAPPAEEERFSGETRKDSVPAEAIDLKAFADFFNKTMEAQGAQIPPVRDLRPKSKRTAFLLARLREYGKEALAEAVKKAAASDFLNGGGSRGFVADFEWLFRPNNFPRVLEGTYDNRPQQPTTQLAQHDTPAKHFDRYGEERRARNDAIADRLHKLAFGTD